MSVYFIKKYAIVHLVVVCLLSGACQSKKTPPLTETTPSNGAQVSYNEPHRPRFHFTPPAHWMNDPNGMVYYEGEYHLFYQHYPDSSVWGPMHWGHAVSKDLVQWTHLPIALYPDSLGYIFSGSAVVDWHNDSGFGQDGKPPLIAMYTYHDMAGEKAGRKDFQSQAIAYSNDRGRSWTKYAGNPVLPNPGQVKDFRDPKLVRHEATGQWIVTLAVGDHIEFWGSKDFKKWTKLSEFGQNLGLHDNVWECPDLFPMPVEGTGVQKWVLIVNFNPGGPNGGSGTQYFVGDFDGKTFTPDPTFAREVPKGKGIWLDWGKDNYAGVTWSDVPRADGRRLLIGWMSNWQYAQAVPTEAWRSGATLPRVLTLTHTNGRYRLSVQPVRELEQLRAGSKSLANLTVSDTLDLQARFACDPAQTEIELGVDLKATTARRFGLELSNTRGERYRIGYEVATGQYFSDRTRAGDHAFSDQFAAGLHTARREAPDSQLRMHLFFDVASAELFADGGAVAMTELYFPAENFTQMRFFTEGGKVQLTSAAGHALRSIWH